MKRWLSIGLILFGLCLLAGSASAQDASDALTILVSSPGEGEVFYVNTAGFRVSVPITGQVISYHSHLNLETVEVTLELADSAGNQSSMTVPLDDRGYFKAWASMLSPEHPWPYDQPHIEPFCRGCHRQNFDLVLPVDVTQLVITARADDGRTAQVTRHLTYDYGAARDLAVMVEGLPPETADAQINATTLIYNWRRRTFHGAAVNGQASLSVEGLAHADLTYEVALSPIVVDGTLYTADTLKVIVPGGAGVLPAVRLLASPMRGSISGRVVDGVSGEGVSADLLAVDPKTGSAHTAATSSDGTFMLDDLPVTELVLLGRAPGGFHLPQRLNLVKSPVTETVIHLTRAGTGVLQGSVMLDGHPLPFAQVTIAGLPTAHADPLTGSFEVVGVDGANAVKVQIAAAGCYGVEISGAPGDLGEIELKLHKNTQVFKQGDSRLYLPAQSAVTRQDDVYTLQSGVLWVTGAVSDTAAFQIQVGAYRLRGVGADFAVEKIARALPRLYVSQGEVLVTVDSADEPLHVTAGQTLALEGKRIAPVNLTPGVGSLLRALAGSAARFEAEPPPAVQQAAALSGVVVTAAQVLMLAALAITFASLPGLLVAVGAVYLYRQRRING